MDKKTLPKWVQEWLLEHHNQIVIPDSKGLRSDIVYYEEDVVQIIHMSLHSPPFEELGAITEENYRAAVKYLELSGDQFEAFAKLVEDYEQDHFPIEPGKPEEIAKLKVLYDKDKKDTKEK